MQHQDDDVTPVAYDPCRPIHYVVRPDNAPYGGEWLIQDAVARVSAVTGLQFIYDGATAEATSDQREPFQPDRYGDRWAPVLVTWDTDAEEPQFAGGIAGLGGSQAVSANDGPGVFVTGTVQLDAAEFADVLSFPDGAAMARAIVLHEFGHVVGLQHVDDPTQLMYPSTLERLGLRRRRPRRAGAARRRSLRTGPLTGHGRTGIQPAADRSHSRLWDRRGSRESAPRPS